MAAAAQAARAAGGTPAQQPFAEVTRDAKRTDGFLPLWTKDDRTWIEIPADRLGKPFFLSSSVATGLGERGFWPGLMGGAQVVEFRRAGNNVQLVARNLSSRAGDKAPVSAALSESYSDSLMAFVPMAAQPHPERKSLLVDASALLFNDLVGAQTQLEASYRVSYSLDRANTSITRSRATAAGTSLTVRYHYSIPRVPIPPALPPGVTPPNPGATPSPPRVVPDPRSLFLSYAYTMAPLPAEPMKTRAADPRVGFFVTSYTDLADDNSENRRTHLMRRWRLEKKDPAAEISEPKEPIRVVMDKNIPPKWRPALRDGILEWNKAFERAGFRNAIAVEQQADDADWSTLEGTRILAVRWFAQEGPGSTAVGPSQSDPRTGEILRGASIIPENWVRVMRSRVAEVIPRWGQSLTDRPEFAGALMGHTHAPGEDVCTYGHDAADQAAFGLDLLAARGDIDPNSPEAEKYIAGSLKDVTMHEVGHAIGLRHNFRASGSVKLSQLRDPAWTARNGLSPSVMDYNGANIPLQGEPVADYNQVTLGAYDYWAVEVGYRQWADAESEKRGLAALLAKAHNDPMLAYGTDEDLGNNDPLINQRDMGDDPLAWAQRQMKLSRELFQRTVTRKPEPNDDFSIVRRAFSRLFATMGSSLPLATKTIGGVHTARVTASADRPLVKPVPVAQQRAALDLVVNGFLSSSAFKFDPAIMGRVGVDHFERLGAGRTAGVDFSVAQQVGNLQRGALDSLMNDGLATRLADAEVHVADPRTLLSFAEVQDKLSGAVWAELGASGAVNVDSLRRNLQREHVRRLASSLVRPAPNATTDVRAVYRQTAQRLQGRLQAVLSDKGSASNSLVRAHLEDSLATISEALKAPLVKQGA